LAGTSTENIAESNLLTKDYPGRFSAPFARARLTRDTTGVELLAAATQKNNSSRHTREEIMRTTAIGVSSVILIAMPAVSEADSTASLKVTARVVRHCSVTIDDPVNCSPETLRVQSTYSGTASVTTSGSEPAIWFVGPRPSVERKGNIVNVSF
jgi:hypothetical protein